MYIMYTLLFCHFRERKEYSCIEACITYTHRLFLGGHIRCWRFLSRNFFWKGNRFDGVSGKLCSFELFTFYTHGKVKLGAKVWLSQEALKQKSPGTIFHCLFVLFCGITGRTTVDTINGISLTHRRW